jgi:putative ABC transport system permease protein
VIPERELASRLQGVAGVTAVTVSSVVPPLRGGRDLAFAIEGGDARASGRLADVDARFFGTLGLKTLRGRTFNDHDPAASEQVIISDVLAGRYWPSADPVGQYIRFEGEPRVRQIVGVVSDVRRSVDVARGRIPYVYRLRTEPVEAAGREPSYALLRTASDAAALAPQVRAGLREILPERSMPAPATLEAMMNRAASEMLLLALMFTPMVVLTLVLSAAGIYGLIAQTVTLRKRELGVRAALGAERRQLVMLILGDGLKLARAGLVFGLVGVVVINRIVMSVFVGVTWAEPAVVVVSALIMVAVTIAASYRPASRAARVDPMTALRCE